MITREDLTNFNNITSDSRQVEKNSIFVAIKGQNNDGHNYIEEAIKKGATLIVIDKNYTNTLKNELNYQQSVKFLPVDSPSQTLSHIAALIYKQPENIVAVTGTDGKTSVAYFYKQIVELLGYKAASIGTLGVLSTGDKVSMGPALTTPTAEHMHRILHQLKSHDIDNVILEASSHGLDQSRIDGVRIKAAAFTSFGQDHLDYHKDIESYLEAKLLLYNKVMSQNSIAIINSDMDITERIIHECQKYHHKVLTYGKSGNFLKILHIEYRENKSHFDFILNGKKYSDTLAFIGDFQIHNILCALCLAVAMGFEVDRCLDVLKHLKPVPGRMEQVRDINIFIDFAHTPESLQKSLTVLHDKKTTNGRLIVVFGCGGDRDKEKRSKMGKVANDIADVVIVTDDNPRTEDPALIRRNIMSNCPKAIEIGNREKAIKTAVEMVKKDDFLLIAGKGHESTQIIGDKVLKFSDKEVTEKYIYNKTN